MEVARRFDLLVAGAGPAGAAAAITAARAGARVRLLEQGRFPRHKVCGEFVSSECLELLAELLGGNSQFSAMLSGAARVRRARFYLGGVCAAFEIPECASISRFELDHALWETACAAGVVCEESVRVDAIEPGFWARSTAGEFFATTAIAASGRWSKLRQPVGTDNARWLGIKAHFHEANPSLSTDLYFSQLGYCGVQPLTNELVNVCAMIRADAGSTFDDVFELHPELKRRSSGWTATMAPVLTSPLVFAEPQPERDGVFFVGDAAGFIDPFAGDGISLALRTGAAAAQVALTAIEGRVTTAEAADHYRDLYARRFLPAFRNAARARRLLSLPGAIPEIALRMMNIPAIARWWFSGTRGRRG